MTKPMDPKARGIRTRKKASGKALQEADSLFGSDEPFKAIAARLGISPNTLRQRWVRAHGQEAFKERGRRLQRAGQARFASRSLGRPKAKTLVEVFCSSCGAVLTLSKQQLGAQRGEILCAACEGLDTSCPVCDCLCKGTKGLSGHFRHQQADLKHQVYLREQEDLKWKGLREGEDYVSCRVCGFKGKSLSNHVKLHNLKASEYRNLYRGAPLMSSRSLTQKVVNTKSFAYDISKETLLEYVDDQGRVVVEAVSNALQCTGGTVLRYCRLHGLPSKNRLAWQRAVLNQAAHYLGSTYEWEWSDPRIRNPETGRVLNFDGFFPEQGLIIEAHGDQHYVYSEKWHGTRKNFRSLQKRDAYKLKAATDLGFRVKIVRSSDPIYEGSFWTALLEGDPLLWENKTSQERSQSVENVLSRLRSEGWRDVLETPSHVVLAEYAKLRKADLFLDEAFCIRPYSVRGTAVCSSFFSHRYEAKRLGQKMSVREAWEDDGMLRKAIRLQLDSGHPTTPERVRKALIMYCRAPSVFRPAIAKFIYDNYCGPGGVVWDPCAGYGGRLLGAMAAGVSQYIGTDIEPRTVEGNLALARALNLQDRCLLKVGRAETYVPSSVLDLVFTSPPYFNLEIYGKASALVYEEYGSPLGWAQAFLEPVMRCAFQKLRSGGYLVLNLPSRPIQGVRLDLLAEEIGDDLGFEAKDPVYLPIRRVKSRVIGREPLLIWKHP